MVVNVESCHQLVGAVQNYDWGLRGSASLVAKLSSFNAGGKPIEEGKPYAELWMGTHSTAPSHIKLSDGRLVPLRDYLKKDLPFLFKVLSVGKALSIQAHPDVQLAQKLHVIMPQHYPDPNHKPEMAIALTKFEALCGFRPMGEILEHLQAIPELASLLALSRQKQSLQKATLKDLFAEIMRADKSMVIEQTERFAKRVRAAGERASPLEKLCLCLNEQFPGEVGCFCPFLLNYLVLEPGEAIFLAANEPHAYLSGDCVECMALSDNVVRAGLTPKFRDLDTLIDMLTYKTFMPSQLLMKPSKLSGRPGSLLYQPPVPEFAVIKIALEGKQREPVQTETSDAILLCVEGLLELTLEGSGDGTAMVTFMQAGTILLLERGIKYSLTCQSPTALCFQAFAQQMDP